MVDPPGMALIGSVGAPEPARINTLVVAGDIVMQKAVENRAPIIPVDSEHSAIFQCLVGARVGDLCKLTKSNIDNGTLSYIPRKTKDDKPVVVTVPLSTKALEILKRYELPDGRLLPFISDQKYNKYLKDLFEEAKITRVITRLNPTTRKEEQVRICDIASSHMARRAFIGNLYGKVDSGIISSMSGHIQGSKAFTRYYDVSKELQQQAINLID